MESSGQLAISGVHLTREYTDESSTLASFPKHRDLGGSFLQVSGLFIFGPLPIYPEPPWIELGDLDRFNDDGSIRCFGRTDTRSRSVGSVLSLTTSKDS